MVDIHIDRVWKQYRGAGRVRPFWALRDVSLEVPRGRSLGVIGRNGAGKSTLMKLLAGITTPTRGSLTLHGRVAALIEVGSGFHPELTGRENVFLSGAILGMRRREIVTKLPHIAEFAGIGSFLDTPVKWYSSGMYVRLGFSVAAHLDAHILLVDEVLAVGDAEFQTRCVQRIDALRRSGTTIVFITHNLTAVEQLCDMAVLLDSGAITASGAPADVVATYHRSLTSHQVNEEDYADLAREGAFKFTNLRVADPARPGALTVRTGGPLTVALHYRAARRLQEVEIELSYYSADGRTLIASARTEGEGGMQVRAPGGTLEFTCPALPLPPGTYYLGAVARELTAAHVIDWWDGGTLLHVEADRPVRGQMLVPHEWRVVHEQAE